VAIRQRTRSARLLVVILVTASLAIITVDYRGGDDGPLATIGRAAHSAIAPMQSAVSSVVQPIANFFSSLADLPSLAERNQALRDENEALRTAQQVNQELQQRLQSLQNLLGLQTVMVQRTQAASVIASSASNFEWSVTIDVGSNDGVVADMAVVTGAADGPRLVGRIIDVTPDAAVVQLVIDRDFAVSAYLPTSREEGLVEGRGADDLRMGLAAPGIEVNDEQPEPVFTLGYEVNGQRGLYPPEILIGTVSRAFSDPSAVESFVTIRPAVDFSTLRYVLVVMRRPPGEGAT
jgi:rod shape-determining protein MreC